MAKKVKEQLEYYIKKGVTLSKSSKFIYEMMVYELNPNGASLYDSKETSVKEFKGFGTVERIDKSNKKFIKYVDLIGAPIEFIEENKFKLLKNG